MPKIDITRIDACDELNLLGYKYQKSGDNEIKFCCPVHEDKSPSAHLNITKNLWVCSSSNCAVKGDILSLLSYITGKTRNELVEKLSEKYDLVKRKVINPETVERFHKNVKEDKRLLEELYKRGVTDDLIRKARLGYHDGRITIPVYDLNGYVVNVRKYLPGAESSIKMLNTKGFSTQELYQVDNCKYDRIWICGGEIKALVAAAILNKKGIGAVAATMGEGNWNPAFNKLFKDKIVYICFDIDEAGINSVGRVASQVMYDASKVYVINLPLDKAKHPHGDINDYVAVEGKTDLVSLMDSAEEWVAKEIELNEEDTSDPTVISLAQITRSSYVGRKIQVSGIIASQDTNPYIIPKKIKAKCTMDQDACCNCVIKAYYAKNKTNEIPINPLCSEVLDMINGGDAKMQIAIRKLFNIGCKVFSYDVLDYSTVIDCRLSPKLDINSRMTNNILQPTYCFGHNLELNAPYKFTGKVFPSPSTQQAIFLVTQCETDDDSLKSFSVSNIKSDLTIFRPKKWAKESITEKLDSLYEDIETNVTRIFKRRDLHLIVDLTYHSPLMMNFDDQSIKGWVNTIIVGDSSQGKSETLIRLIEYYQLGERVDCKNATVAGLLGGLQQIGTRWFVSWGTIPTHDMRLVVLEEVKGCHPEVLTKLTDMRSSGIAEIPKIEKRKTFARTRLIFISNPVHGRLLSTYNFGIESIKEIFNNLEDIRRFDLCLLVSCLQVEIDEINMLSFNRPKIENRHSSEACRELILWAWTRKSKAVVFCPDTRDAILNGSISLCRKYSETFPLVDRGTTRHKIARLAAALAARTYSTEDGESLIVRKCHVEFICDFIDRLYSDGVNGYLEYSQSLENLNKIADPLLVKKTLLATKHPLDFVEQLLYTSDITIEDIEDWCEVDKDEAKKILSLLVRKHCLRRIKRKYVKSSEFIEFLRTIDSKDIKLIDYSGDEF